MCSGFNEVLVPTGDPSGSTVMVGDCLKCEDCQLAVSGRNVTSGPGSHQPAGGGSSQLLQGRESNM